jgi:hypothetical protein
MATAPAEYEPRYLAGIVCFNRHDFFEAHEVWEGLWLESTAPERRFYQALIQAAVALYHFGNGNFRGATKLFQSSRAYMEPYGSPYLGLDATSFWAGMERCFAPILNVPNPDRALRPDEALIPVITLEPPPESWPEPEQFLSEEE